jgi:hypothetical protein
VKRIAIAAGFALSLASALGVAAHATDRGTSEPELALQYDFFDVQGSQVSDGSGRGHTGTIVGGTIVSGKRKPAIQLAGAGQVATDSLGHDVELAGRALTVGAMCRPGTPDGVIASMGDATDGFSLYLKDGVPHFAVRSQGVLHEVVETDPVDLDQWVHLAGVIGEKGEITLLVNAFPAVKASEASFLARTPAGPFAVGAGGTTPVGAYPAGLGWSGLLEDVRLYVGAISRETHRDLLGDWANRPGCGCHK